VREQQELLEAYAKHIKQKSEKVMITQNVLAELEARQQDFADNKVRRGSLACT